MSNLTETTNNQSTDTEQDLEFDRDIHKLGRYGSIVVLALMFAVPAVTSAFYGLNVDFREVFIVLGGLAAIFIPIAVIENISYYAIIGAGGVYLGSITGNILNMKLPSAIAGMKIAGVEPGSRKGDIISILSICSSSLVTIVIVFLGAMFLGPIVTPALSHPTLAPGFYNVMPALMGAMLVPAVIRSPRVAATPFFLAVGLCLTLGFRFVQSNQSYLLPVIMLVSVLAARVLYNMDLLPQKTAPKKEKEE